MSFNGTVTGSPTFGSAAQTGFGTCVAALSDTAYISLPSGGPGNYAASDTWTIELFLKATTSGTKIAVSVSDGSKSVYLYASGTTASAVVQGMTTITGSGGHQTIGDNAWHHMALVVTGGTAGSLYVDGYLVGTSTGTFTPPTASSAFIGRFVSTGFSWPGSIDEVAFSTVAQYTGGTVGGAQVFTPPSAPLSNTRTGQQALYHLDENAGASIVTDSNGGGGTVTIAAYPPTLPASTAAMTLTLYGTLTTWSGGTTFSVSGLAGASLVSQSVTDATHASVVVTTGSTTGSLTISDGTNTVSVPVVNGVAIAGDSRLVYSPFNWNHANNGRATTVNPGAYLRTIFSGTSCKLEFDFIANASPYPVLSYRIDGGAWSQATLAASLTLATGLANRRHYLEVVYAATGAQAQDRWNTPVNAVTITDIVLDSTATFIQPTPRPYTILLYGDSITEGVLVNGSAGTDATNNDATKCWSWQQYHALPAEVGVVGFGGSGSVSSGAGNVPALLTSYNKLYAGVNRSFSSPAPDVIVILEGQNDADTATVTTNLQTIITGLRAACPAARILCLGALSGHVATRVQTAVAAIGSASVTYVDTTGWISAANDCVDSVHPWAESSIGLLRDLVANQVRQQLLANPANKGALSVKGLARRA